MSIHSFFPTKNLGCFGDGGAISTSEMDLAERAKMISRHGQGQKYAYELIGCNSRLDTIQAAILRVKLRHLDQYIQSRQKAGKFYDQLLQDHLHILRPIERIWTHHTYNQYVIKIGERDLIKDTLNISGIPTMIYYPSPLHLQKAYAYLGYKIGDFPVAERLCKEVLALPMHTELLREEQDQVINSLIKSINSL